MVDIVVDNIDPLAVLQVPSVLALTLSSSGYKRCKYGCYTRPLIIDHHLVVKCSNQRQDLDTVPLSAVDAG